jgi:4,5-DOPA dioxygenase extradiol
MFPAADIPVLQLGLDTGRGGAGHYALARRLGPLREDGVLLLCSGNIVHNLHYFDPRATEGLPWALRFRDLVERLMRQGDHAALMRFHALPDARLAAPSPEHFLPLLYALANGRQGDAVTVFCDEVIGGIAMTSLLIDRA